jgi:hypothetical protein
VGLGVRFASLTGVCASCPCRVQMLSVALVGIEAVGWEGLCKSHMPEKVLCSHID